MEKRILLITPENEEINRFRKKQFNNFIQITMAYLAAFIDESKYNITLVDEYNQRIPYEGDYDLVALTVNTPNASHCYRIAEKFRSRGCHVVMGGPHATLLPDEAAHFCDYIIIGEAEITWPQFLEDYYNGVPKKVYTSQEISDLVGIPIPRRDLVFRRFFTKGAVIASRGCPYNCSYCNLKQIFHNSYRTRPIEEVIADLKAIRGKYFVFWDDNFFGDVNYAKALLREVKKLKMKWAAQVTLQECQDEELLKLAKEAGCIYFFIGLESFSTESLLSVNKGINNVIKYQPIIDLIHKHGISVQAGIIFGFDTDDLTIFDRTLTACNELGIDGATVSILTPLPNTPLYRMYKEEGRLLSTDWSYYNGKTRVAYQPKQMTPQQLFNGYMKFRKDFYSIKSITKRLWKSRTNLLHNLVVNIGYKMGL